MFLFNIPRSMPAGFDRTFPAVRIQGIVPPIDVTNSRSSLLVFEQVVCTNEIVAD